MDEMELIEVFFDFAGYPCGKPAFPELRLCKSNHAGSDQFREQQGTESCQAGRAGLQYTRTSAV